MHSSHHFGQKWQDDGDLVPIGRNTLGTTRLPGVLLRTEPKIALLAAGQANKSEDDLLRQGVTTLTGKPADRDGRLVSQKNHLPSV